MASRLNVLPVLAIGAALFSVDALGQARPAHAAPSVALTDPADGNEVPVDTGITITFSEEIVLTGDAAGDWFTFVCTVTSADDLNATVGINSTTVRTVGHDGFTPGEECTFTILAAAVEDVNGVNMLADYAFTFTIEDLPAPVGCTSMPRTGCFAAERAQLDLKKNADPTRSQLLWKWQRGDAVEQEDLGDPITTTSYVLCIYDQAASVAELVEDLVVEPSAAWTSKAPKGLIYKDKPGTEDGVQQLKLNTGAATKAQAQLKAKGMNLLLPLPSGGGAYFDADPSVVVQLVNSDDQCWTTEFTTATKNTETHYKAKAP
jgi:hypothetical protein